MVVTGTPRRVEWVKVGENGRRVCPGCRESDRTVAATPRELCDVCGRRTKRPAYAEPVVPARDRRRDEDEG